MIAFIIDIFITKMSNVTEERENTEVNRIKMRLLKTNTNIYEYKKKKEKSYFKSLKKAKTGLSHADRLNQTEAL